MENEQTESVVVCCFVVVFSCFIFSMLCPVYLFIWGWVPMRGVSLYDMTSICFFHRISEIGDVF